MFLLSQAAAVLSALDVCLPIRNVTCSFFTGMNTGGWCGTDVSWRRTRSGDRAYIPPAIPGPFVRFWAGWVSWHMHLNIPQAGLSGAPCCVLRSSLC